MHKSKLAVLGASYLQLPLVKKAIQLGIEVYCFSWDDNKAICKDYANYFYPISVLDKDKILNVCKQFRINGIVTIATDICIPTISYIAEKMGLVGNCTQCAKLTTNKMLMRKKQQEYGFNSPQSICIKSINELEVKDFNFPVIVKPVDRSGSLGVTKVHDRDNLKEAVSIALQVSIIQVCLIEEFIDGVEVSVETLSYEGVHKVLAITDKITTHEPFFVELEHHQPSNLSKTLQNEIINNSLKILDAFEVTNGASHLEYKITSNSSIFLIEIGSRMGGDFIGSDLVKLSTGFDFLDAVIKISLGEFKWEKMNLQNKYAGVYFLGRDTEYLLPFFSIEKDFIIKKEIFSNELHDLRCSNDRSGYIIYQSDKKIIFNKND